MGVVAMRCAPDCTCGRHTAVHPGGPRPGARQALDIERLRALAPIMTRAQIADALGVTRKVVDSRMAEHGIPGRPESTTWAAKHKRLRKIRGRAAGEVCVKCDQSARDWAQVHTEDGTDPWADYVPLCRQCHLHYDRDARLNEESLAKWRASASPAIAAAWTPERRQAMAELARTARIQSPPMRDPATGRFQ